MLVRLAVEPRGIVRSLGYTKLTAPLLYLLD
jgi:hypothetical protein